MKLVLASSSPRRAEILRNAGFDFEILPSHVDETLLPGERPADFVFRLAVEKARHALQRLSKTGQETLVVGADTVVVVGDQILGKPKDENDARRMLKLLSGTTHEVLTGLTVIVAATGNETTHVESTRVSFVPLTEADIDEYLRTGEPFDKAGAYGIQGIGGKFIWRIEGCYFNVMGLPVSRLWSILSHVERE